MFDKILCINLDRRKDRWNSVSEECERMGFKIERFRAIEGGNTHIAFNNSQYECLKIASEYKSSLILEDDVVFKNPDHLGLAVSQLPENWDMLYLGANTQGTFLERYSDNLFRIENSHTTHAVAYSHKMAKWIVENFDPNQGMIYDEWLRVNVQKRFECFLIAPMIAWQKPGFSDLWGRQADYTDCFNNSNNLLK